MNMIKRTLRWIGWSLLAILSVPVVFAAEMDGTAELSMAGTVIYPRGVAFAIHRQTSAWVGL
ncbi:MAG: hypothetical protein WC742_09900 [Gallionellaceae bacterium]|jgi:hypothetical protein